ncbi:MAG: hypothetical protein PHW62_04725 [Candidatus Ratteibacteria bacterium]|nr:hypothetical protein [Candidatus Ratteibacteria bacterium]
MKIKYIIHYYKNKTEENTENMRLKNALTWFNSSVLLLPTSI